MLLERCTASEKELLEIKYVKHSSSQKIRSLMCTVFTKTCRKRTATSRAIEIHVEEFLI